VNRGFERANQRINGKICLVLLLIYSFFEFFLYDGMMEKRLSPGLKEMS